MHTDCINAELPAAPPAACFRFYKLPVSGPGVEGPEVEMIVFPEASLNSAVEGVTEGWAEPVYWPPSSSRRNWKTEEKSLLA